MNGERHIALAVGLGALARAYKAADLPMPVQQVSGGRSPAIDLRLHCADVETFRAARASLLAKPTEQVSPPYLYELVYDLSAEVRVTLGIALEKYCERVEDTGCIRWQPRVGASA